MRDRQSGAVRLRLHQRHDHRHPEERQHEAEAWDLVKYLTTNTHALAELSNGLRNVPTTSSSLRSKELDARRALRDVPEDLREPALGTSPITAAGVSYTNAVQNFATKWQAGKVADLAAGLAELDKQLDAMVAGKARRRRAMPDSGRGNTVSALAGDRPPAGQEARGLAAPAARPL